MARQHIQLTPAAELEKKEILRRIQAGDFSKEEFEALPAEKQSEVNDLLFDLSSSSINLFHGTSALEFLTVAAIRMMLRYKENTPLTEDDRKIESFLEDMMSIHEIGNRNIPSSEWLFDYTSYAKYKTEQILRNREEHIDRKRKVTGNV